MKIYEKSLPNVNSIVMAMVTRVTSDGVYVSLLEYDNIEAYIPVKFLTKSKWIKSLKTIVKEGEIFPVLVESIDDEKNYVNLDRLNITHVEDENCRKNYKKYHFLFSIMTSLSYSLDIDIQQLYQDIIWKIQNEDEHVLDSLLKGNYKELSLSYENELRDAIDKHNKQKLLRITGVIRVICGEDSGATIIRDILSSIQDKYKNIEITIESPPDYFVSSKGTNFNECSQIITQVTDDIKQAFNSHSDSSVSIVKDPYTVSVREINK